MAAVDHLCVLLHGLWGTPVHLDYLRDTLRAERQDNGVEVFVPESNSNYNTYDGIEVGAERICHEIEARIKELDQSGTKITKISIVGYSLGGLFARFIIGLLYKNGIFDNVQPVNFTTFATPHLGVKTPAKGYSSRVWNWIGSSTLSATGQQMFLVDNFRETGRPLLDIMADPSSTFIKGLRMFKNRSIYANTLNDRSVPFYTAHFSRINPYADIDAVEVHHLPETDGKTNSVILDPKHPFTKLSKPKTPEPSKSLVSPRTRVALPFYFFLVTVMPVMFPLILMNAGLQTIRSSRRMRLHEGGSTMDLSRYRSPFLEEAQAMQDRMMERLAAESSSHGGEEYLPTPPPESTSSSAPSMKMSEKEMEEARRNHSGFPTLALSKEQFAMIEHLDEVGFVKYAAHIVDVHHTHAAIVVRTEKPAFAEGKVVVKHWVENFEA